MKKTEEEILTKKELLEIFLKHRVDSPFPGDWESIFKGTGYEFWTLKEWERGDPFKNIDWKARAKTGKYYVREYLAESYFTLMILYDVSGSMAFGRKDQVQAQIAVSLAYSAIMANNGCGLILFADEVTSFVPPRMGRPHFLQIVNALAEARPLPSKGTDLNRALAKLINDVPESLTFVLSDFMYPFVSNYHFQRVSHGSTRHEVKALQILENSEIALPESAGGLVKLTDLETGREMVIDLGTRHDYDRVMGETLAAAKQQLQRAGIDSLVITPDDDIVVKINEFMKTSS